MEIKNMVTGVTAQVETDLNPPVCRNSLMNAVGTKTAYVIEETGATFVYTDIDLALAELKAEVLLGGMDATFRACEIPAHLEGDEMAEWVVSNGEWPEYVHEKGE